MARNRNPSRGINPDPELWDAAKKRAQDDDMPLSAVIDWLLRAYVSGELTIKIRPPN